MAQKSSKVKICPCRYVVKKLQSEVEYARFRHDKLKIVPLQYLRAMKLLHAQTGTTRLQLQFQLSSLHMSYNMMQRHGIDPKQR